VPAFSKFVFLFYSLIAQKDTNYHATGFTPKERQKYSRSQFLFANCKTDNLKSLNLLKKVNQEPCGNLSCSKATLEGFKKKSSAPQSRATFILNLAP